MTLTQFLKPLNIVIIGTLIGYTYFQPLFAQITLDESLGNPIILTGPDYQIPPEVGQQQGTNLFHSFHEFNLHPDESATFSGIPSTQTIISRVTGKQPSHLNGLLRSTIPHADFYFLNPFGIIIGPHAKLDVSGNMHLSTADHLKLADGNHFSAQLSESSTLTTAPVTHFGFLDDTIAPILITGHGKLTENLETGLQVAEGKMLSLIGGEITLEKGNFIETTIPPTSTPTLPKITLLPSLAAPGGQINLISLASPGQVQLHHGWVDVSSFRKLADLSITQKTQILTSSLGAGHLILRAGKITISDSELELRTLGDRPGGLFDLQAQHITFSAGTVVNGHTHGAGKSIDIRIQATDQVTLTGENAYGITRFLVRSGNEGDEKKTEVNTGPAGTVSIEANDIQITQGAGISVSTYTRGKGGDILLKAKENITLSGESTRGQNSYLGSASIYEGEGAGNTGNTLLEANTIFLNNGVYINSRTVSDGHVGTVTLRAHNQLNLTGKNSGGAGSRVYVTTTNKTGRAGDILIDTRDLLLADGAYLTSSSFGPGRAGNIEIQATGTVTVTGTNDKGWRSTISSSSNSRKEGVLGGEGGNITIKANQLIVKEGAGIAASSIAAKGMQTNRAGTINLQITEGIELIGVNPFGENEDGFGSGIYARSMGSENNAGEGGKITLEAGYLTIEEGAVIKSSTNNTAPGGNIQITVHGPITITGKADPNQLQTPAYSQVQYLQEFTPTNYNQSASGIYASSEGQHANAGAGGNITLTAKTLTLTHKGKISTSSAGGGKAGNIIIEVEQLHLDDHAMIASESRLLNTYHFATEAERDQHLLIIGDTIEVTDMGNHKMGGYVNLGTSLISTVPIDTVHNLTELYQLPQNYNLHNGYIVKVNDIGNGNPSNFIYTHSSAYNLSEWVRIDEQAPQITLNTLSELDNITGWFEESKLPHPAGTLIQVNQAGNGKPANFIYTASIINPTTGNRQAQPLRLNTFSLTDPAQLNQLTENHFLQQGDLATLENPTDHGNLTDHENQRLIYDGQHWVPLNTHPHSIATLKELQQLTIAKIGDIAKFPGTEQNIINQIYTGQQWIPLNKTYYINNLSERDTLPVTNGDLVKVAHLDTGQPAHFLYFEGQWLSQARGGEAGNLILNLHDNLHLSNHSAMTTEATSSGGGQIHIHAPQHILLENSQLTTSVQEGIGNGGNVTLTYPDFVILKQGQIRAQANEGQGGNIHIQAQQLISTPDSLISASSQLGIDGEVNIEAPDQAIIEELNHLPITFIDISNLLRQTCQFKSWEEYENRSRFTFSPLMGSSLSPNGWQSSRLSSLQLFGRPCRK